MKIKTYFFVLILGLCNLIKGGNIPSREDVIKAIKECNYFPDNKIEEISNIGSDEYNLTSWKNSFEQVINTACDIGEKTQKKLAFSLLVLGILQVNANDIKLIHGIKMEIAFLKIFDDEDLKQSGMNITWEELINELNKRILKEDLTLQEEPIQTKKRKLETR